MADVAVIGAGLAGLSCALTLERFGLEVALLEAADAAGGRVRTDVVEGFRLDRGFQVLLAAYPETKRLLNYEDLNLRRLEPGALVWRGGRFHYFADPLRAPLGALRLLIDPVIPLGDKLRVGKLRALVQQGSYAGLFTREETTTRELLQRLGFSAQMMEAFFEPFFGGVFLELDLVTSSRLFQFLFRMFASGATALPAQGMEAIPRQLAAKLQPGTLKTHSQVRRVTGAGGKFVVESQGGSVMARAVVAAVAGDQGNALVSEISGWRLPEVQAWNRTTTFYYAAERPPLQRAIILLNGEGRAAGPVNDAVVMSAVSAEYAPAGAHLIAANVVGEAPADGDAKDRLDAAVRVHLARWFGAGAERWPRIAAYPIARALPLQRHAEWEQSAVRVAGAPGLYLCGDYRETSSIQGALASGRRAAEAVVRDLGAGA